jgi:hypothetical protein
MVSMDTNAPSLVDTSSSIGKPVDVATRGSMKASLIGLMWLLVGGVPATLVVVSLIAIVSKNSGDVNQMGVMLPLAGGFALAAWFTLATAFRRFRAAFEPGCYFRASPMGVSFRVPGSATLPSLLFSYRIKECEARWDEVRTWYPYVHTHNGIPTESAIVVDTVRGEKIKIHTMYFTESRQRIAENISRVMSGCRP